MEGYVQEHSSGKTLAAVLHDPANKVIMDGSSSTFAFYWSAGLRAHQAFQRTMI
ncbi:sulfotransferase [Haematococcus lacustris]|uniref:Sulfotransferase n=1 Tax=Haematococcus lacustris TaxID=44745 RepID=A0A699ZZU1_HAELA|nr:sulfotransferase [Haematococcus lacustris]